MKKIWILLIVSVLAINSNAQTCSDLVTAKLEQYFLNIRQKPDSLSFINCAYIQSRLSDNEVFLDFLSTTMNDAPIFFLTIIAKNKPTQVEIIPQLKTNGKVQADTGTRSSIRASTRTTGYEKYENLLQFFDKTISNFRTVYYSTTGDLNLVNFKYLRNKLNVPLFERFQLVRLHSAASFLNGRKQLTLPEKINVLLAGNIDYNCDTTERKNAKFNQTWNYLPGTKQEINEIRSLLIKKHTVTVIDSCDVTETKLLRTINQGAFDIVHIATHGFHVDTEEPALGIKTATFPLDKSGIVLSGANNTQASVAAFNSYGLFTASDMLKLKLSSAGLIVLSTCHSGEGTATQSGAPIGLILSMLRQGSSAMVVSNRAVNDALARQFMTTFYRYLSFTKLPDLAFTMALKELSRIRPDTDWDFFDMIH